MEWFFVLSKKRKHQIMVQENTSCSARFPEMEQEEEFGAFMFWWPRRQGQPSTQLVLSQVEQRVWAWLPLKWHRCSSWLPWLQSPPHENNIFIRKATGKRSWQPGRSGAALSFASYIFKEIPPGRGLSKGQQWNSAGYELGDKGKVVAGLCASDHSRPGMWLCCRVGMVRISYHVLPVLPAHTTTWKEPWAGRWW